MFEFLYPFFIFCKSLASTIRESWLPQMHLQFAKSIVFLLLVFAFYPFCTSNNVITSPCNFNRFYTSVWGFRLCLLFCLNICSISILLLCSINLSLSTSPSWLTFVLMLSFSLRWFCFSLLTSLNFSRLYQNLCYSTCSWPINQFFCVYFFLTLFFVFSKTFWQFH